MRSKFGGVKKLDYVPSIVVDIPRPLIRGYTTQPAGTVLTITVDGYNYSATVTDENTWSITPSGLIPGAYAVTVTPPAGAPVVFSKAVTVRGGAGLSANNGNNTTTKLAWSL